jgi:hypothetical protein
VIAPGTTARFSKNQFSGAEGLLNAGVRYLDVRVTYMDGGWYTENTKISGLLEGYVRSTIRFLAANPGELVIFDLPSVRLGESDYPTFWRHLWSISEGGQTLADFIFYDSTTMPLDSLTLDQATNGGSSAGIVMFARDDRPDPRFYFRDENVRSRGLSQRNTANVINAVNEEQQNFATGEFDSRLRVSQAQLQPALGGSGLINSLLGWSYMRLAQHHNAEIINYGIESWLPKTPIIMLGFAESTYGNFNPNIVGRINAYNREFNQ